ncbi:hypothetical protein TSUD_256640 [Trifolium subterraneum]|uniref:F-box associated beta-propeller type 1 domain-containing protein n=1 Tax=Trifolium subterraneum TaxID=3900 RepID=A0A2Z6M7S7_TRISU|nr:hypothetical protein TSUD_256640 [Trifolium subterraneum]
MEKCVPEVSNNNCINVHIPDDTAFSILSKLPIKSLKRFGCVRKSWSLLFDNHYFMNMYRNNFLTKDHSYYDDSTVFIHQTFCPFDGYYDDQTFELYCVSGERFENRVKLDWPNVKLDPIDRSKEKYDSGFNIIGSGSVHGILCLHCASHKNVILWNPSTNQFKVIPHKEDIVDPREFGYDRHRDDYKVICQRDIDIEEIDGDHDVQDEEDISFNPYITVWEIYSLRSNSWRKLDIDMDHVYYMSDERLYIDGLSHGLCAGKIARQKEKESYLLSFDWGNEVFLKTYIPSDIIDGRIDYFSVWIRLVLLNGSIALILNYTDSATFHISILGELGVKESWTKIFTVGPLPCLEFPIGAGKKGDMLFRKTDGELVWFDLNTQMIEDLGVITSRFSCKIVIHKENLLTFEGTNI